MWGIYNLGPVHACPLDCQDRHGHPVLRVRSGPGRSFSTRCGVSGGCESRALKFEDAFWSGGSLDDLYERVGQRPADPMTAAFPRRCANGGGRPRAGWSAAARREPACRQRIDTGHAGHARPGNGPPRTLYDLPRLGRLDGALHRPVRHGLGHHEQLPGDRRDASRPALPSSRRASPKRCSRPRSAWSPRFPAVVAYNKISNDLGRYGGRLEAFAVEFSAILSRQLEEGA